MSETKPGATQEKVANTNGTPALEVRSVSKYFGSVNALEDISLAVYTGQVTCVLGDNGAGKSTLIKILSGVHAPDKGEVLFDGEVVSFAGPRDARARGIATVFQDLATVPLMSVWRNFFLGNEPTRGRGPLQRLDVKGAQRSMRDEMSYQGRRGPVRRGRDRRAARSASTRGLSGSSPGRSRRWRSRCSIRPRTRSCSSGATRRSRTSS